MTVIEAVECFRIRIPLRNVFRIAYSETSYAENVVVRVRLSNGVVGLGEASPSMQVTGETPSSIEDYVRIVASRLKGLRMPHDLGKALRIVHSVETFSSARSALETALLDAYARQLGVKLVDVLGGKLYEKIETDVTISLGSPEEMASNALSLVKKGFKILKLKLGGPAKLDIERVRAVREVVGDSIRLRVDVNQAWSLREAIWAIPRLEELGVELVEQPTPSWCLTCLKELKKYSGIPIAADESAKSLRDVARLAVEQIVDVVNIKLAKIGGPLRAVIAANIASEYGLGVMYGCMLESRLGITAAASAAYASPGLRIVDLDSPLLLAEDPVEGGIVYEGAVIKLPEDGAGLAASLTEA